VLWQFFLEVKGFAELTPLSCAYNFFRLTSVLQICFKLSKYWFIGGTKLSLKYSVNMLLTCTLYYDTRPSYLISSIRTVCKYRKFSFLTGLITSLTDLLQAYHQGRIGTSKTAYRLPCPRPDRFALRILLFRARRNYFSSSPGTCSQAKLF